LLKAVGQQAACLVTAKYIVLKIECSLSGIDHLLPETEAVHAGVDDSKCRIPLVFVRRTRKLLAEAGVLRTGERHGRSFGKIRAGRKPRATAENCRCEQRNATSDCALAGSASAVSCRSENVHATFRL
jgi:hypothetical protein